MPVVQGEKVLLFRAGELLRGARIGEVLKVVTENNLTIVPKTFENVKGAMFHEGRAIPVFCCEGSRDNKQGEGLILLLNHTAGPIGLAIDEVIGVVDDSVIERDEEGTLIYEGETLEMIDSEKLVSPPRP